MGRLPKIAVPTHSSKMLGPLLELRQLSRQQDNIRNADQSWLAKEGYQKLLTDLDNHRPTWASFSGRKIGYMRVSHLSENIDAWTDFTQRAKRAAVSSGLTGDLAGQIVSAFDELASNVIEHSKLPSSGYVAFAEGDGHFEIVVADEGIGVLESLRSSQDYAHLSDHSAALIHFIQDGVTRTNIPGRGNGFRPLFKGLANAHCSIRFRSGDHALEIDGRDISRAPSDLIHTSPLQGLFCSVVCNLNKRGQFR